METIPDTKLDQINRHENVDAIEEQWSVVVNSIGKAGIAIVSALRVALPLSDREIATRLFQAPSILAENLSRAAAEQMTRLLSHTGLDVAVVGEHEGFKSGSGDFELSLGIHEFSRVYEIIQLVMELTGVDTEQAVRIVNTVPSVFLANISENNAGVLSKRFAELGVELDVSRPEEASYDVFLQDNSYRSQQELLRIARELNLDIGTEKNQAITSLVGLGYEQAQSLWQQATDKRIHCRILNRAYQRYDVRLDTVDTNKMKVLVDLLSTKCRIPEKIIPTLIRKLPVVVTSNVPLKNAQELICQLHETGAIAVAELTASLSFNIEINEINRPEQVQQVLEKIGGISRDKACGIVNGKRKRIDKAFTYNQARWIITELKRINTKAAMVRR